MADQTTFIPITPADNSGEPLITGIFGNGTDIGSMLNTAFIVAINLGAILAMIRIIYGGWLYMGSSDMWSNKHHAKEVIGDAVFGLLLLLAIWIILNQINPDILNVSKFQNSLPSG